MEKGLSFVQLAGALAFVLFSETQRLLATMLQPAALALLAARAETRRGYCHPLAAILYPQEKIWDGSKRFFRTVVKKVSYNSYIIVNTLYVVAISFGLLYLCFIACI